MEIQIDRILAFWQPLIVGRQAADRNFWQSLIQIMNREQTLLWLAEIFEESPDYIRPERSRDDIPTWDSVGVLNLIAGIDEKFGVVLSDKEIRAMTTVGDILTLLEQKDKLK